MPAGQYEEASGHSEDDAGHRDSRPSGIPAEAGFQATESYMGYPEDPSGEIGRPRSCDLQV